MYTWVWQKRRPLFLCAYSKSSRVSHTRRRQPVAFKLTYNTRSKIAIPCTTLYLVVRPGRVAARAAMRQPNNSHEPAAPESKAEALVPSPPPHPRRQQSMHLCANGTFGGSNTRGWNMGWAAAHHVSWARSKAAEHRQIEPIEAAADLRCRLRICAAPQCRG